MNETWTDEEKYIATLIKQIKGDFTYFLEFYLEEYEEQVNGQFDVFQLAKEVFEIESISDDYGYENLEGFYQRLSKFIGRNINSNCYKIFENRQGLKIRQCKISNDHSILINFYIVEKNYKTVEILVHKSAKEFYKTYL